MKARWLVASAALVATPARADVADQMSRYVGYTIVASKRIVRWVSDDRREQGEAFEGCLHGRVIVFDDNTALTCADLGLQYTYYPRAVILSDGQSLVMIVGDKAYSMI